VMTAGFDPDMSANSRTGPLSLRVQKMVLSMVAVVAAGILSLIESLGLIPYLGRMTHWLGGNSLIGVTAVEGHLGSYCCTRRWESC